MVDSQVGVLITPRCGQNAADIFALADMKLYKSADKLAADTLKAYENGTLSQLKQFHGGFHGVQ